MRTVGRKSDDVLPRLPQGAIRDAASESADATELGRKMRRPAPEAALAAAAGRLGTQALAVHALDGLPPLPTPSGASTSTTDTASAELLDLIAAVLGQMSAVERNLVLSQCIGDEHAVLVRCITGIR